MVVKYKIQCPYCREETSSLFDNIRSTYDISCSHCKQTHQTRIVKIRAKRSRGDRNSGTREFSVRVIEFSGKEDLIEFRNRRYQDFELRSGDLAAFSFEENDLRVVQNLTINKTYCVEESLLKKVFRFFQK